MPSTYKESLFYSSSNQFLVYKNWADVAAANENRAILNNLNTIDSKSYVTGGLNPNWKSDIRHHRNATTSLDGQKLAYRHGPGSYSVRLYAGLGAVPLQCEYFAWGDMSYCNMPPTPTISFSAADNLARQRFYKRALSEIRSFTGLTFAGELGETLRMLRNPAKSLRRGLDDYVKTATKRTRRAKKTAWDKIIAETWLEFAFGATPLVNDVKSAGQAISDRLNRYSNEYVRVSGSAAAEAFYQNSEVNIADTHVRRYFHTQTMEFIHVKYWGQIKREAAGSARPDMRLLGVSWGDVIPTAWELLPYSFLADYFTNIGDILESYSVHKSDIAWSSKTVRKRARRRSAGLRNGSSYIQSDYPYFKRFDYIHLTGTPAYATRTTVNRSQSNVSHPTISLEIPGMGRKWINMSALAASRRKYRRGRF
jgi:hypothetical protein